MDALLIKYVSLVDVKIYAHQDISGIKIQFVYQSLVIVIVMKFVSMAIVLN